MPALYYRFEPRIIASSDDVSGWWDFKKHLGDFFNSTYRCVKCE